MRIRLQPLPQWVGSVIRYVLQNQLLDPAGVALGEIADHDLGPGAGNDAYRGEEHAVVDLDTRNVGVEHEVVGAANELTNAKRNALIGELNLVAVDGVFETARMEFFVCH
jgi:hypothetical protein